MQNEPTEKRCSTCGALKSLDAFAIDRSRPDGRKYVCRTCDHARYKRSYKPAPKRPWNAEDRLWSRVDRSGECWVWTGGTNGVGYGRVSDADGRTVLTHRLVYQLEVGPIPEGLWVLHHCDNPPCVNPAHLFLGTVGDNNRDARAKGRAFGPPRSG